GGADRLDKGSPNVLAFLAMAHHRLGRAEQGRAALARLREILDRPPWAQDAAALDLAHEAEALIAPKAATTERGRLQDGGRSSRPQRDDSLGQEEDRAGQAFRPDGPAVPGLRA